MPIACMLLMALTFGCISASDALPLVQEHVLFTTTAAMLWALGKMVTSLVPDSWRLFRRTLPWHPVLAGAWLGLAFPHLVPVSVGAGRAAACLYFGASGVLATYGHDVFRTWAKYRGQQ